MPLKILVTRPEPDASRLAARLKAAGHAPQVEPLMVVVSTDEAELSLSGVQAIAFTSANGVRAFAAINAERRLPIFAVGEATAVAANAEGFKSIHIAGGDVTYLAGLIGTVLDPDEGAVLHVAGKTVAGDLAGTLAGFGFQVDRAVLYGTTPLEAFSAEVKAALETGSLNAVMLYSPRTARVFKTLVEAAGLGEACRGLICYALSENVASAVTGLAFASLEIAAHASEDALMELLEDD